MGWSSKLPKLGEVLEAAKNGALPKLIETLQKAGGDQAWLARALRVDLATIVARPELTFPCVWNRSGSVRFPSLAQLLHDWRRQHGSEPWARALRPPRFGLDGPLREEYRGDFVETGALLLTQKLVGNTGIAWDRQTGLRVQQPSPTPHASSDWVLDRANMHGGHCRVLARDGKAVLNVRLHNDDSFTCFAAAPDGRLLVGAGWFDDYAGTVCLFDIKYRQVRWRAELNHNVSSVAISDDGGTIVAFSSGQAVVLDASSGSERRRLFVDASHGALDPEGVELVTRSRRALRVWDVRAPELGKQDWSGAGEGWVGAAFSPDGERLLTGQLLCDARSGAVLAKLQTDGPGYLEGGPPLEGRVLTNDRFIELSPFAGITIWDAATGQRAEPSTEPRRFMVSQEVRFSRDGRFIVCGARFGAGKLRILRVDDGASLAELPHGDVTAFEVDPTRPRLATAHQDGWFRIWQLPDLTLLHEWGETSESPVRTLAYSLDGARLVARSESGWLRQWNLRDGSRLGERQEPDRSALRLHGWLGFVSRLHPYNSRWDGGFWVLEHDQNAHAPIAIPTDQELEIDSSGSRAAFRYEHFALER